MFLLSLYASGGQPGNNLFIEQDEYDNEGENRENRSGHKPASVAVHLHEKF
jgi:hypothetical protein